jgi:hypothetical protein
MACSDDMASRLRRINRSHDRFDQWLAESEADRARAWGAGIWRNGAAKVSAAVAPLCFWGESGSRGRASFRYVIEARACQVAGVIHVIRCALTAVWASRIQKIQWGIVS